MTMQGCRRWIGWVSGGVWLLALLAPLLLPPATMSGIVFLLLLGTLVPAGWCAVLTLPRFHWAGVLIGAGMLLLPNLWSWPPETLVNAPDTLASRLTYLAFFLLIAGLVLFPVAVARFLWRYDLTCLMVLITNFLVPLVFTAMIWRLGEQPWSALEHMSVPAMVFWMSILGGILMTLGSALLMSLVNLGRLLYAEFAGQGSDHASGDSVNQGRRAAPQTGQTSVEP